MARNRILVVEDDEAISRVIIKNLISTGYAATPIYDGKEAAELLAMQILTSLFWILCCPA